MDVTTDAKRLAKNRAYQAAWRAANPDRVKAAAKRFRDAHREQRRAEGRAYAAANRERISEYGRSWTAANPELVNAKSRAWRGANPEKSREAVSRRRARIRGAAVVERINRLEIIKRDRGICHLCGKRVPKREIVLDHLIPISRGGDHTAANLAVAHNSCNRRKWVNAANEQLRLVG